MSTTLAQPTPARSIAQRMDALHRANEIRLARAELKRDLKAGRQNILDVLLEPPAYLLTAKIYDVLLAAPKFGRVKVTQALNLCRISPAKTVGGLSTRQRHELLVRLGAPLSRAPRPLPRYERDRAQLTELQASVLRAAFQYGNAGLAYIDDIARSLGVPVSGVSRARNRLRVLGLLDEFGQPTERGRLELAALDRGSRELLAA